MKAFTLLALLLSTTASASTILWQDLVDDGPLYLTQTLRLKGTRGEDIRVRTNQSFTLESITNLEGLPVVEFILRESRCAYPDLESELEIILPEENSPTSKAEVGVFYLKGCALEIMVENKDLRRPSFFRD